jgi:hypothetical protein
MYRITFEIGELLLNYSKDSNIPGIKGDSEKPFVPRNHYAIGYIDPFISTGADLKYAVVSDYAVPASENYSSYEPEVAGIWLCKNSELKTPPEPFKINRTLIDSKCKDPEEEIEISDCCILDISVVDRLTCPFITSIQRLLELEPDLQKCLTKRF